MKKAVLPLIFLSILILLSGGGFVWWKVNSAPVSNDKTSVRFVIPNGKSASQVSQKLFNEGLIKSSLAFKLYVQLKGKSKNIQPGIFNLSKNQSVLEIAERLTKTPDELTVKIIEGKRREEIVEILLAGLEIADSEKASFRSEFLRESKGKEGYLFPDTYNFFPGTSAAKVVLRLTQSFDQKISDLKTNKETQKLSLNQIVTLASIIERETRNNEERPVVAGIMLNRIKIGMPLQVDAAVQYAVATARCPQSSARCNNWWPILTRDDMTIDSPYNTYKYPGFPPGPIAGSGKSSLSAAFNPEVTDYLYYIHSPDGKIHYAKTLAEHNENVRKYLGK